MSIAKAYGISINLNYLDFGGCCFGTPRMAYEVLNLVTQIGDSGITWRS